MPCRNMQKPQCSHPSETQIILLVDDLSVFSSYLESELTQQNLMKVLLFLILAVVLTHDVHARV